MLQTWFERATKLRQLVNHLYDAIDQQLVGGGACENHVTPNNHVTPGISYITHLFCLGNNTKYSTIDLESVT